MPPFTRNQGGDNEQSDPAAKNCRGDNCGRLKVEHRGILVCAVCDAYRSWPDFQTGGRRKP